MTLDVRLYVFHKRVAGADDEKAWKCHSFILLGKMKNIEENGRNYLRRKTGSEEKESYQDRESGTRRNVTNGEAGRRSLEQVFSHRGIFLEKN